MCPKIMRILFAACVASLAAMTTSAQVTGAEQRANLAATPASRSAPNAGQDSGEADAPAFYMPANVLEDTPRDARSKPVGTCAYDPLDRQGSAACRRKLEIAQTL